MKSKRNSRVAGLRTFLPTIRNVHTISHGSNWPRPLPNLFFVCCRPPQPRSPHWPLQPSPTCACFRRINRLSPVADIQTTVADRFRLIDRSNLWRRRPPFFGHVMLQQADRLPIGRGDTETIREGNFSFSTSTYF